MNSDVNLDPVFDWFAGDEIDVESVTRPGNGSTIVLEV